MGYRVHTFSPEADTPTGQVADVEINAPYEDMDAIRQFASGVSVVTFEFENVPTATAQAAAKFAPVRPDGSVLHTTQNRLREKTFLARHGLPVAPFRSIQTLQDIYDGLQELGTPAVLKTAGYGYDGKGQFKISSSAEAETAFRSVPRQEMILESFVDFQCEVSVVGARGCDGNFSHWGVIENTHRNHILDVSTSPASISPKIQSRAVEISQAVMQQLDVVGLLCVEFFVTKGDDLLINELAPRPHNSGHLTFDASITSQFEQQLRAVCGLPLGSTEMLRPAAMANLLGDLWRNGEPNWAAACSRPEVKLHVYGKLNAKPGRKMGHLTALAESATTARAIVSAAREALLPQAG
jgi:5-(carboxyamino)imidazole ribonucleotide synthase